MNYWLFCDDGGPIDGPYDLATLHQLHRARLRGALVKAGEGNWQPAADFLAAHPPGSDLAPPSPAYIAPEPNPEPQLVLKPVPSTPKPRTGGRGPKNQPRPQAPRTSERRVKPPGFEKWTWSEIKAGRKMSKTEKRYRRMAKALGATEDPQNARIIPPKASENPEYWVFFIVLGIILLVLFIASLANGARL